VSHYNESVQKATKTIQPWKDLMKVTSSIVTDGESLNLDECSGLWRKLEQEKSLHDSSPLLKIWCAAHRSNLAYKDVSKSVTYTGLTLRRYVLLNLLISFCLCSFATIAVVYVNGKKDMTQNQVDFFESGRTRTDY